MCTRHRPLLLFLLTAMLAVACGDDDNSDRPSEVSLDEIIEETRTIRDTNRAETRVLDTRLWYAETGLARPACGRDRCSLLMLAHGFGGRTERFDSIGKRLAAAGYIVAAVTFPRTNQDAPGGFQMGLSDTVNQPGDLSAVLDALLEASEDPGDPLFGRIDADRIGAVGHSLGGATVIAASRVSCCTEPRFGATAYVEPAANIVEGFFGTPYSSEGPPTLTFQGEIDFPITPEATREFHSRLGAPKMLVEMVGGNHINLIERFAATPEPILDEVATMMIAFFDFYLSGGDNRIDETVADLEAAGHAVFYSP